MEKERGYRPPATVVRILRKRILYAERGDCDCDLRFLCRRRERRSYQKVRFFLFLQSARLHMHVFGCDVYMNGRGEVPLAAGGGNARCDCSCAISIYAFVVLLLRTFSQHWRIKFTYEHHYMVLFIMMMIINSHDDGIIIHSHTNAHCLSRAVCMQPSALLCCLHSLRTFFHYPYILNFKYVY